MNPLFLATFACLLGASPAKALSTATVDGLYFSRDLPGKLEATLGPLEAEPENPDALWRLGRSWIRLGERLEGKKPRIQAFERAENALDRAIKLDASNPEAHYWRGIALGRIGQTRGILKSLFMVGPIKRGMRRVLELDPKHSGAHHVLGEMYRQLPGFAGGSHSLAVEELEKALALGPDHTAHYPALAQAYLDAGRREDAIRVLKALDAVAAPADPPEAPGHREDARRMLDALLKL